jgi:phosphate transport system substrate-binding protein
MRILLLSIAILFLPSCNNKKKVFEYTVEPSLDKGVFALAADTSISDIIQQCKITYENRYDSASIRVQYMSDIDVITALEQKKLKMGAIHRKLSNNEYNRLLKAYATMPLEKTFAYDGIVLAVAKLNRDSIIPIDALEKYLKSDNFVWATLPQYQYLYSNLLYHFGISSSKTMLKLVQNFEDLAVIASKPNTLALLPFSSFSDSDNPIHKSLREKFTFLSIKKNNEIVNPSQEDIYLQIYPFILPYNLVLCKLKRSEGMGFVNYLYSVPASKMILKNGLVPAKMPERLVEVK